MEILDGLKRFFSFLIDKLQGILNTVVNVLPNSPFIVVSMQSEASEWFAYVNWFIPLSSFVAILEAWLSAIVIWYVYQVILRWAKVTE